MYSQSAWKAVAESSMGPSHFRTATSVRGTGSLSRTTSAQPLSAGNALVAVELAGSGCARRPAELERVVVRGGGRGEAGAGAGAMGVATHMPSSPAPSRM